MNKTAKSWFFAFGATGLLFLTLMMGLAGGVLLERQVLSGANPCVDVPTEARSEFRLMVEGWRTIEQEYVHQEGVEPRDMAHGALSGMVQTLGDVGHTRFLTPEMTERHEDQIQGEFEGIGAYVEMREGRAVIVAPIDDTPAQRAGLRAGDVILEVNGEDVTDLPLEAVVSRISGSAGTEVTITVMDPDTGERREVALERAEVDLDLVTWQRLPGTSIAYVRVSAFSEGATEDLGQIMAEIQSTDVDGLVLDLRNNPGGLLGEAIGVVSQFVERGDVLLRRDAEGDIAAEVVRQNVDAAEDIPMVAVANGGTASAAEIVTGALQDHERATVVGTTTFGAGTVLNKFPLSDGSALLLAVEEWLTPDGREIWREGLAPDVKVSLSSAVQPLQRFELEDMSAEELQNSDDVQLLHALELLDRPQAERTKRFAEPP